MTIYPIGQSGQTLCFSESVLTHFKSYQQRRFFDKEAGGQLFATFDKTNITIVEATGPRRSDRRSRYSYVPDRSAEQKEILNRYSLGRHFIGDWHTHPVRSPSPSPQDLFSMGDTVRKSRHALNGFVLVVVGTGKLPANMYVCLHDGARHFELPREANANS